MQLKKDVASGKDPVVGRAVTQVNGEWEIAKQAPRGRFYAVAARATSETSDGETVTCTAARSKTIKR